jgi:cytochrome c553
MTRALALAAVMLLAQLAGAQTAWSADQASKSAKAEASKSAAKADAPKGDAPKAEAPKAEAGTTESAKAAPAKADTAKGQAIMTQVCAACHGADGNSVMPANPKLAGQFPEYLQKQLNNFKAAAGKPAERPSPVMAGFVAPLSADDIRNVSAFLGAQKPGTGAAKNKDTVGMGQKLWRGGDLSKGIAACASCHGANGGGMPVQFPRLAGQHADYTEAQLKAFRAGERKNDPGNMMRSIALKMTDAEIRAVADYVAGLR